MFEMKAEEELRVLGDSVELPSEVVDGVDGTLVVLVGKLEQVEERGVALPVEILDLVVACTPDN